MEFSLKSLKKWIDSENGSYSETVYLGVPIAKNICVECPINQENGVSEYQNGVFPMGL